MPIFVAEFHRMVLRTMTVFVSETPSILRKLSTDLLISAIIGAEIITAISCCPVISYITSTPSSSLSLVQTVSVSTRESTEIKVIALVLLPGGLMGPTKSMAHFSNAYRAICGCKGISSWREGFRVHWYASQARK